MTDLQTPAAQLQGQQQLHSSANAANGNGVAQTTPASTNANPPSELSNADKKRLAKAEKAAKRAKSKDTQSSTLNRPAGAPHSLPSDRKQSTESKLAPQSNAIHKRTGSASAGSGSGSGATKPLEIRRRQSQSAGSEDRRTNKQVDAFAHLYGQPRRRTLEGTAKEVNPEISALALQQSNYVICGSHARCVAMLLALKSVISSYMTPHGTSLPRHLASHYLSPQLSHLKSVRPFSTSQANSIRWLKTLIANLDPSAPEDDAKSHICTSIDTFIRDRFTVADQVIAETTSERIQDGDVVLTYGKSAVVQSALLLAAKRGIKFRLVVVDGRPLIEGKNLAQALSTHVDVSYCFLPGLSHALVNTTKCILGAHAIFANGRLQSRVGSAMVAMAAKLQNIPVMVCAESIKLTDRVALNSLITNELAPEEELIDDNSLILSRHEAPGEESKSGRTKETGTKDMKSSKTEGAANDPRRPGDDDAGGATLAGWRDRENLQLLNILYDVTPSEYIDVIVTELGSFPPSAVPVVHRISGGS